MADIDGFDGFYRDTSRRLARYAYGLTGNTTEAQDLTQEAYARAWQHWRTVTACNDPEAWLRVVVTRLSADRWRRLRVRRAANRMERQRAAEPPSENTVVLVAALRSLPVVQRRALVLHYMLDRSVADIAAETATNVNTVKSWLSRGRAGLAGMLGSAPDLTGEPENTHTSPGSRNGC